jgi:2-polyprenyl-3-methyl-5-hydroxy-6-metoxy-1,4-benzoquinol methylase
MDFAEQNQIASHSVLEHWYYQAKFELLRRTLSAFGILRPGTQLADLGCGLGVFLTLLEKRRLLSPGQMIGIDPAAQSGQHSIGGTVPIATAWPDKGFDLILLMDVLEHIEDDRAALAQAWTQLKPGGYAFITVPAFSFLWSHHDEVLGHCRRYTMGSLENLLQTIPDLKVKRLHYFYALIFPIAMVVRRARRKTRDAASDLKPAPPWLNLLLKKSLSLESLFARHNKIAGLTVVALVQKQG